MHSAKTCFKFSSFLPTMATEAPSFENKTAVAAPIPELAPIEKKMKPEKSYYQIYRNKIDDMTKNLNYRDI